MEKVLLNSIDVLEFSLPIPILVEQIIVALQFLSNLSHKMEILLGLISGNTILRAIDALNLHPQQPLSLHESHHEPQVYAPEHYDHKDHQERYHHIRAVHFIFLCVLQLILKKHIVQSFVGGIYFKFKSLVILGP